MKKTFQVNINGNIFYIDEDAYELLLNYLDQLKSAFSASDGEEIVSDIESRISELFAERIAQGANVIVYADVNDVIGIMGRPSDISDCNNESSNNDCKSNAAHNRPDAHSTSEPETKKRWKKLFRNPNDKVLGGVLGGLSVYLGWNANIMRLLFIALTVITQVWPLTIVYLIAWMIIPPADTRSRQLEMYGEPVTVDNIGRSVLSSTTPPPFNGVAKNNSQRNILTTVLSLVGKCIVGFLGFIGGAGALVATGFFLFFMVALIALSAFGSTALIAEIDHDIIRTGVMYAPYLSVCAFMCFALCFIVPGIALAWLAASFLFNAKGASAITIIFAIILEILFIVATVILFIFRDALFY